MSKSKEIECCLCGEIITLKKSNSAEPIMHGRCCNDCNVLKVMPARQKRNKERIYAELQNEAHKDY